MSRLAFSFVLLAVLLSSYSECTPMHPGAVIDDHIAEDAGASLASKEKKVTCETVDEYCLHGRDLEVVPTQQQVEFCKHFLKPYLCNEEEEEEE